MEVVIVALVLVLFVLGYWWLKKLQRKVPKQEALFIQKKYYGWIPISICFLALIITPINISRLIYGLLTSIGYLQVFISIIKRFKQLSLSVFILTLLLLISTLAYYFTSLRSEYLVAVIFGSVLSDISAYSLSKLTKTRHYLPAIINKNKTIEGIIGGFFGAYLIVPTFFILNYDIPFTNVLSLAGIIGISSNAGDILNSLLKRRLGIKDWGETFQGHGGIFDRFVSFYFSYSLISLFFS